MNIGDSMKIRIVGSGSMWNKYNSACYLVDNNIMIDFPNGACKYLYRFGIIPNTIDYILITHFHGDHYFDIPFYVLNKSKSANKNINIYCSKEGKKKINSIGVLAFPNSFKDALHSVNLKYIYSDRFKVSDYTVNKLLVDHGRMKPAYGYIFNYKDKFIGFTGDTHLCENVEYMASICNYLFCDCMFLEGNSKHQGINDIEYLSKKYPKCKFVTSHMEEISRNKLKKLNIKNVMVPEDGDIIIVK